MEADSDYFLNSSNTDIGEWHDAFPNLQLYEMVCLIIIFLVSMPGNSFLLWVLLNERAWKTTPDILLLQLIVSNLCLNATLPFFACNALHGWVFGGRSCRILIGLYFLGLNSYATILAAMALHSYVTVIQPPCLSTQSSSQVRILVSSIVIWLLSASVSIMLAVKSYVADHVFDGMKVCIYYHPPEMEMFVKITIQLGFSFFIPTILVTFCYLHMWVTIKQCNSARWPSKITLWVTFSSFLCFAPYSIHLFIEYLMVVGVIEHNFETVHLRIYVLYISFFLQHFSFCLNPLIQIIGAQRFRRQLTGLWSALPNRDRNNINSMNAILLENVQLN